MKIKFTFIFTFCSMLLISTACEKNNGVGPEEHTNADGFILKDENGIVKYSEFAGASNGVITIAIGETLEFSVHFLDHAGVKIEHEEDEEEDEDELFIAANNGEDPYGDSAIATIKVEGHDVHCDEITDPTTCANSEHCEWHTDDAACEDEHDGLGIHITGISVGSTTFKLKLMHGDHADYTSQNNVPITVTTSN